MPSSCGIAIVGGGLAGLAAANALASFGMRAEVFEAASDLGEIGAAVNTSPQANKALQAIGLGDKIAAVANSSPGIYTRNMQTGDFLEFNDRREISARYGAPYSTAPICWTPSRAGSILAPFIWDIGSPQWKSERPMSSLLSPTARKPRPIS
jgi:hypothetical protein